MSILKVTKVNNGPIEKYNGITTDRIIIEGLDGVGKSTLIESLKSVYIESHKYPTDSCKTKCNDVTNDITASLISIEHILSKINKDTRISSHLYLGRYISLIACHLKNIAELYLDLTYININDQSTNQYTIRHPIVTQDRGIISTFLYNYMEYKYYSELYNLLTYYNTILQIDAINEHAVYTKDSQKASEEIRTLYRHLEQEALDSITKSSTTMINCWTEFNTILKDRSIYYRDNKNYNDNYFILVLDQNIRSSVIGNEKIDYKIFFEKDNIQCRLNTYMDSFKYIIKRQKNNIFNFSEKSCCIKSENIHFIELDRYNDDKGYYRLKTSKIKSLICDTMNSINDKCIITDKYKENGDEKENKL